MHILQAERDALLKPLNAVTGIVERRHTLPILAYVLIEKRGNALSFLATDLEIQITTASQGEVAGEDFRLTTSAKKLQDILRALPDGATVTRPQDLAAAVQQAEMGGKAAAAGGLLFAPPPAQLQVPAFQYVEAAPPLARRPWRTVPPMPCTR